MGRVKLYSETLGESGAPPLVILHGLLGSGKNWATVAKQLVAHYQLHLLDLRHHGRSPQVAPMDYTAMAEDVVGWMSDAGLEQASLLGHSMGGKVAMAVACRFPVWIERLMVVDIAPKTYAPRWRAEFAAMRAIDVPNLRSRADAEAELEPVVKDWAFRKFLLTNLERRPEGGFRWALDLAALEAALPELFDHPLADSETYDGPTLFLRGERSKYLLPGDENRVARHFPQGRIETVTGAGHNIHFDQPSIFVDWVLRWMGRE